MDINAIGIPLAFIILSAIGLWLVIYASGSWLYKAAFIVMCLYFSFAMWHSLGDLSGWATNSQIPKKSIIHWLLVQEPSKTDRSDAGAIYVWATEVDMDYHAVRKTIGLLARPFSSRKGESEPRAYRMPYSELAHKQAVEAMKIIMSGKTLVGERSDGSGDSGSSGDGAKGMDGRGQAHGSHGSLSQDQVFRFYELPAPKLPEKITGK
jgi:hypothetical protein